MKRLGTILGGFIPAIALVAIATWSVTNGNRPVPTSTSRPAVVITLPSPSTTQQPVAEIELRLEGRQLALTKRALGFIQQRDLREWFQMEHEYGWTIMAHEGPNHENLATTTDEPWDQTSIDFYSVRANARALGLPAYKWLAVILVHEWTHVDGHMDSEVPSVRAQIAFCKTWRVTHDRYRCLRQSTDDLGRIGPNGEWRA